MLLYEDHKAVVYALAFAPDGSTLACGAKDGSVFLRDAAGSRHPLFDPEAANPPAHLKDLAPPLLKVVKGLPKDPVVKSLPVHAVAYTPDGSTVIIGGAFGWLAGRNDNGVWRVFGPTDSGPVTSLAMLDDKTLAVGIGDRVKGSAGKLELWDVVAGRKRPEVIRESNGVRAVATCPAKRMVAWVTGHRKVCIWETIKSARSEFPQPKDCHAVALSPDGTQLAAAVDYGVRIYTIADRCRLPRIELKGHKGQVSSVAFSPDGSTIATGSWDETVKLWDAATGLERATFRWGIGRVYCLTYAPDGLRLAAGSDLGKIVVWDME